ncbi:hypothetical protein BDB01DRAFT_790128 [Pilobolus umbonatus]|nr:hypothetical protein BDB01DRAFT_790128 [Pilobolus umbonatus]
MDRRRSSLKKIHIDPLRQPLPSLNITSPIRPSNDPHYAFEHLLNNISETTRKVSNRPQKIPYQKLDTRVERLRALGSDALNHYLTDTASFVGEKLTVTSENVDDIYQLSRAYYQEQQYDEALELLNKKEAINTNVSCRYLAALCSLALDNPRDALDYLGYTNPFIGKGLFHDDSVDSCIKLESAMCCARGNAYLALKNVESARECYKESLQVDAKCYDSLKALVNNNLMEEKEEWEFVMSLPFEEHFGPDADYFRYLYGIKLKKDIVDPTRMTTDKDLLSKSLDVKLSIAEEYYAENRFEDCLNVCKEIKGQNSYFKEVMPLLMACLYELGMKAELFAYAQELMDKLGNDAIKYHAVGLYNLFIKENLTARMFFTEALNINPYFQYSWLCYGHTFAAEKDHDRAVGAYSACSKLIPGSYLPLMNIAVQCMEQDKKAEASHYFDICLKKCTTDPFLYNEVGVYHYKIERYNEAQENLHDALKLANNKQARRSPIWEKIWCNLGHLYRHPPLQDYDRAVRCFQNALLKNPQNSDARGATAMIYHLKGQLNKAIQGYYRALVNTETPELLNELLDMALKSYGRIYIPDESEPDILFSRMNIHAGPVDEVEEELNWLHRPKSKKPEQVYKKAKYAHKKIERTETAPKNPEPEKVTHEASEDDDSMLMDEGDFPFTV